MQLQSRDLPNDMEEETVGCVPVGRVCVRVRARVCDPYYESTCHIRQPSGTSAGACCELLKCVQVALSPVWSHASGHK